MGFLVKLIEVHETKDEEARKDLKANCTHVGDDFWLFEGDEEALNEGIDFEICGEQIIEGYGDLTGSQLKEMVRNVYNIDKCFLN